LEKGNIKQEKQRSQCVRKISEKYTHGEEGVEEGKRKNHTFKTLKRDKGGGKQNRRDDLLPYSLGEKSAPTSRKKRTGGREGEVSTKSKERKEPSQRNKTSCSSIFRAKRERDYTRGEIQGGEKEATVSGSKRRAKRREYVGMDSFHKGQNASCPREQRKFIVPRGVRSSSSPAGKGEARRTPTCCREKGKGGLST